MNIYYQIKTTYYGDGKMIVEYTDMRICRHRPSGDYTEDGDVCSYFDWLTAREICASFPQFAKKYHFDCD